MTPNNTQKVVLDEREFEIKPPNKTPYKLDIGLGVDLETLANLTGVSKDSLRRWSSKGYIAPSCSRIKGVPLFFGRESQDKAYVMAQLLKQIPRRASSGQVIEASKLADEYLRNHLNSRAETSY
ncbi:MAG: hypothetical protein ABIH72_00015 [archaeon]